jgi:hypothetical protein
VGTHTADANRLLAISVELDAARPPADGLELVALPLV